MKHIAYIFFLLLVYSSCTEDDQIIASIQLADVIENQSFQIDNVIACASGSANDDEFIVYLYPRPGVTDIRYFETNSASDDKNDYRLYTEVELPIMDVFNGHIMAFTNQSPNEKWVIVTFMDQGVLQLSNPIRLKHKSQNTLFSSNIEVDHSESLMPMFNWEEIVNIEDAIYFQVVTDDSNQFLSGTYTFEDKFQYYNLDNVVLNVTEEEPPNLVANERYGFTLMGVSLDNWVNVLGDLDFIAE